MSIRYIRETVIKDVVDLLSDFDEHEDKLYKRYKKDKYKTSISKSSKDLIMTFPVICSNTIDPKTATMISKAIERKCVTMLQLLFAANMDCNSKSAEDFIKHFHNNINMGNMSVDDYIKISDKISKDLTDSSIFDESGLVKLVMVDKENLKNERVLPDSINESSLQDYKVIDYYSELQILSEADKPKKDDYNIKNFHDYKDGTSVTNDYSNTHDHTHYHSAKQNSVYDDVKTLRDIQKSEREIFSKQLLDTDVKKANEMVPSLLIVNIATPVKVDDKKIRMSTSVIVGVKARLIPTDSFDIIDRVYTKHNDSNTMLKLIRATTREISFVKDFLLAIDKAKIDVLSRSRKGSISSLWKALERRTVKSKVNKAFRRNNDASAITSLVITQEELDYIDKNYNINLNHIPTAQNILAKYNLLSLVVVDETIEVAKFLFDGDDTYETLSFNNLERESGDGMYKKVLNLMTKMNR